VILSEIKLGGIKPKQAPPALRTAGTLETNMGKKLAFLASHLYDIDSLRELFAELNFEPSDETISKSAWTDEEKDLIDESETVATKFGYRVYYLRTRENDFKPIRPILAKIIKADGGLCLVCSHNPNGFRWMLTIPCGLSSPSSKTGDLPLVTTKDRPISKTSVEFLENIRAPKKSDAAALQAQVAKAYDTFMVQIRHNEDSKYAAGERSRAFSDAAHAAAPGCRSADLRLAMGSRLDGLVLHAGAAGLAEVKRAVELEPRSADPLLALGARLHELGRHAKAAAAFDRAATLAPGEPAALAGLGVSLWRLGNHAESLDAFSRAAELDPDNAELHVGVGSALLGLGRDAEADCAFARAAELGRGAGALAAGGGA